MSIDRCLAEVVNWNAIVDAEFHPYEIHRQEETPLIELDCDWHDPFQGMKDIGEWDVDAGIMAERSNGSMHSGKPSINRDAKTPVTSGSSCRVLRDRALR